MKKNKIVVGLVVAIVAVAVFLFMAEILDIMPDKNTDEYYQVLAKIEKGDITEGQLSGNFKFTYVEGDKEYVIYVPSRIEFKKDINDIRDKYYKTEGTEPGDWEKIYSISFDNPDGASVWNILSTILFVCVAVALIYYIVKQMSSANKQTMNFGKTRAQAAVNSKVKFTDVAGAEEEKEELKEIVEFLKFPKKFSALGARIPKGVLLVGPPGTGKTLFAKAVAGEANVPFFSVSGSDFVEMFVGVGASRVRDLFEQAKRNMRCIIFIDEIDAVGRQRGAGMGGGHDEREQTLNQLLVQMDGFEENQGIIVMAATNRPDVLDPALLRAGRFDRQIYVPTPDVRGREAIFKVHTRTKPMADDINYKTLARITSGFSGAEIENLLNEAAILAARHDRDKITMADINEGINKVVMGPQKKSRLVTENDKRITAIHEAGHAVLTKLVKSGETVHEVSIIPRGMAAGYTMFRPENDEQHQSKQKLLDNIVIGLGGRVAEEIIIKEICTGASGDIKQVTSLAHRMVTEWGMSEDIGNLFLGGERDVFLGRDFQAQHSYSEVMAARIDAETKKIIDECHKRATELLVKNKKIMETMAAVLLEAETIYADDVDMLMKGASADEVIKAIEEREAKKAKSKAEASATTATGTTGANVVTIANPEAIKQPQSIKPPELPPEETVEERTATEEKAATEEKEGATEEKAATEEKEGATEPKKEEGE